MPKRRKKSKNGSFGDRPFAPAPDCCFSPTSTLSTAGQYYSTNGEKSGSARTTLSAVGAAATAGGGACAICADWALRPPEQATSTMVTHSTETARWAGRETLMLDSGLWGA